MTQELPEGTVTILFTDFAGLMQQLTSPEAPKGEQR